MRVFIHRKMLKIIDINNLVITLIFPDLTKVKGKNRGMKLSTVFPRKKATERCPLHISLHKPLKNHSDIGTQLTKSSIFAYLNAQYVTV